MEKLEQWLPVKGFKGCYEVSDLGRVRSLNRVVVTRGGWTRRYPEKMLSPARGSRPYMLVGLSQYGTTRSMPVHRLVATTFYGEPTDGYEVNHKDGVKTNNRATNLEWVTHKENCLHALRIGLLPVHRGSKNGNAKLTKEKVHAIRVLLKKGDSKSSIAHIFGVSDSTIRDLAKGTIWAWLPKQEKA